MDMKTARWRVGGAAGGGKKETLSCGVLVFCIILRQIITTMCTRTIRINDSLMERVRPIFPDDAALQTWLEQQLEAALIQFAAEKHPTPPCSYSDEEMYSIVKQRLQSLEEGTAQLVDGDEVFAQIKSRYGFKA